MKYLFRVREKEDGSIVFSLAFKVSRKRFDLARMVTRDPNIVDTEVFKKFKDQPLSTKLKFLTIIAWGIEEANFIVKNRKLRRDS